MHTRARTHTCILARTHTCAHTLYNTVVHIGNITKRLVAIHDKVLSVSVAKAANTNIIQVSTPKDNPLSRYEKQLNMHIHACVCVHACRISDLVSAARSPTRSWSWTSWGWQWCSAGSERWVDTERLVFVGTPRLLPLQYPEGRYQSEHPGTWLLVQHNPGSVFAAEWKKTSSFCRRSYTLVGRIVDWTKWME